MKVSKYEFVTHFVKVFLSHNYREGKNNPWPIFVSNLIEGLKTYKKTLFSLLQNNEIGHDAHKNQKQWKFQWHFM